MVRRSDLAGHLRSMADALSEALARYDGGRSSMTRALWAELLGEALNAPERPRTFRELIEVLEARPRAGELFHDLLLLVREQAQVDPEQSIEALARGGVDCAGNDPLERANE